MAKKIFIGGAWPYANGSLHLGHVSSLIGGDILARYFRSKGHEVLYVSGSDCHGTPVVLRAEQEGTSPEEIAKKYHREIKDNFINGLKFSYDLYTVTTTKNHTEVVQNLFLQLYKKGLLYTKEESLPYCPSCKRFLPDRYIEGECPNCGFKNARGDQCDNCGKLLDPKDLISPRCKNCQTEPEFRASEHFFLKLTALNEKLKKWVGKSKGWRANALNFTKQFLEEGLRDRAVTRDIEWGIPIPIEGYENKRIYVWFEAVTGYLSASKEFSKLAEKDDLWKSFWEDDEAVHYYVHGKDNILFHSIIWPAMLMGAGNLHLPDRIVSSEYYTLEKKQFSTSRNWAVWIPDFLRDFDGETLRYYLISNGPETSDADFSWKDYALKVNKELIGNFGNFIHRTLSLIKNNFSDGVELPKDPDKAQTEFISLVDKSFEEVGTLIEQTKFKNAIKRVFEIVEFGNRFLVEQKPWEKVKNDEGRAKDDLAICAYAILALATLINPFLPTVTDRIYQNIDTKSKGDWKAPILTKFKVKSTINPLFEKIEDSVVEREVGKLGIG